MRHYKTMLVVPALLAIAALLAALPAVAKDAPGYIDLDFIQIPNGADEIEDINLGPVLKEVVREARENEDLEIAELLGMVHNLRLISFSLDDHRTTEQAAAGVDKLQDQLRSEDWDRLMRIKDGDEITSIHIKYHDDNMVGLTVVSFTPDEEFLVVNVVGDLDLGKLMRLAGQLDQNELEDYLEKFDGEVHIE